MTATGVIGRPRPGRDAPPRLADYDAERATFRLEVPERYNPVLHFMVTPTADRAMAQAKWLTRALWPAV